MNSSIYFLFIYLWIWSNLTIDKYVNLFVNTTPSLSIFSNALNFDKFKIICGLKFFVIE